LGNEVEAGQLPDDEQLVGNMVARICYGNARDYLNLPLPHEAARQHGTGVGAAAVSAPLTSVTGRE
jgi:hypothetical protein